MTIRIISVLVILIVPIEQVFALTCNDCNTLSTSECLDKFITSHSTDCEDTDNKCIKYKTVSEMADKGSMWGGKSYASAVTRGCYATDEDDGCMTELIPGGYTIKCICSGDDCNAALGLMSSRSLMIFCLFIGLYFASLFNH